MGTVVVRTKRSEANPTLLVEVYMLIPTILLTIAALGGLVLLGIRLSGKPYPPLFLAGVHGLVAVAGFGFLLQAIFSGSAPDLAKWAAGAFGIAAIGGIALLAGFHLRHKPLPVPLILIHGVVAIAGLVILIISQIPPAN